MNFVLDTVQFDYMETRLMQVNLTANELLDMLEGMGGIGCPGGFGGCGDTLQA